jgi:hypothetical protein
MKVYRVKLTCEERAQLQALLSKGKASARTLMHARILLKTDEGVDGPVAGGRYEPGARVARHAVARPSVGCDRSLPLRKYACPMAARFAFSLC